MSCSFASFSFQINFRNGAWHLPEFFAWLMSDEILGINDRVVASLNALTSRMTFNLTVQVMCLMVWTVQKISHLKMIELLRVISVTYVWYTTQKSLWIFMSYFTRIHSCCQSHRIHTLCNQLASNTSGQETSWCSMDSWSFSGIHSLVKYTLLEMQST